MAENRIGRSTFSVSQHGYFLRVDRARSVFHTGVPSFPDGVGRTRCQFGVYAPFGVLSDSYRDTRVMAYDQTANIVQTEDYRVASAGYANLKTAPDDFHVVLGANEIALQAVQRNLAQAIGMPLA